MFEYFSEKKVETVQASLNLTRITGILYEDQYTILIISRSILLRMRNVSSKVVEEIKTQMLCPVNFSFKNRPLHVIMWRNIVQRGRPKVKVLRMRTAC